MEIRCPARRKLFAIVDPDNDTIEVRCRNKACGYRSGLVIIHKFNFQSGRLISTQSFHDPTEGESTNGNPGVCSTVRSS